MQPRRLSITELMGSAQHHSRAGGCHHSITQLGQLKFSDEEPHGLCSVRVVELPQRSREASARSVKRVQQVVWGVGGQ